MKPQNHVVLQARITSPNHQLFSKDQSIIQSAAIDSLMLAESTGILNGMRGPDNAEGASRDHGNGDKRRGTNGKKKQVFFTDYGGSGGAVQHITTDAAETGAPDTLLQQYQRIERK